MIIFQIVLFKRYLMDLMMNCSNCRFKLFWFLKSCGIVNHISHCFQQASTQMKKTLVISSSEDLFNTSTALQTLSALTPILNSDMSRMLTLICFPGLLDIIFILFLTELLQLLHVDQMSSLEFSAAEMSETSRCFHDKLLALVDLYSQLVTKYFMYIVSNIIHLFIKKAIKTFFRPNPYLHSSCFISLHVIILSCSWTTNHITRDCVFMLIQTCLNIDFNEYFYIYL